VSSYCGRDRDSAGGKKREERNIRRGEEVTKEE
jgi:hypothetical protein